VFRETDKQIVSTRGGRGYKMGQRVRVLLDRIDRQQRRLQFAIVPEPNSTARPLRKGKAAKAVEVASGEGVHTSPDRSGKKAKGAAGKKKVRLRDKKSKGKRK
jgi:ribonuclease R